MSEAASPIVYYHMMVYLSKPYQQALVNMHIYLRPLHHQHSGATIKHHT